MHIVRVPTHFILYSPYNHPLLIETTFVHSPFYFILYSLFPPITRFSSSIDQSVGSTVGIASFGLLITDSISVLNCYDVLSIIIGYKIIRIIYQASLYFEFVFDLVSNTTIYVLLLLFGKALNYDF